MNSFNNPLFQNQFNNQNINQGYNSNSNFVVWTPQTHRTNIDTNGYAQGETTSQGFCPNKF